MIVKTTVMRRIFAVILSIMMISAMIPYTAAAGESQVSCIGITSDVHGYSANMSTWLSRHGSSLEYMVFGGDTEENWYSGANTIAAIKNILSESYHGTTAIFTMGNHDWMGGDEQAFQTATGNTRTGIQNVSSVSEDGYTIYTLGASSSVNPTFSSADMAALEQALAAADPEEPFIIVSHYPLHYGDGRTGTNSSAMIDLLNQYPNVFFFWGHNHHSGETNMGKIYTAGAKITPSDATSSSKEINFTYCNSGHMKDEGSLSGTGVRMEISDAGSGTTVKLDFRKMTDDDPVTTETVILGEVGDRVAVTGITAPAANEAPDQDADVPAGNATAGPVTWTPQVDDCFLPGTVYTACVLLTSLSPPFTESTYVTVNGYPATSRVLHPDGTMTVEYVFPATAPDPGDTVLYKKTTAITSGHEYVIVLGNVAMNTDARSGSSSSGGGSTRNYTGLGYTTPVISGDYLTFSSEAEAAEATWTFTDSGNGKWHISNNGQYVYAAEQRNMSLSDTPTSWTYGSFGNKGTQLYAELAGSNCNLCYGGATSTVTVDFIYPSANNSNTLSLFEKVDGESVPSGSTYELASDVESGSMYVIVARDGSSAYALSSESVAVGSTSYLKGAPVTVSGSSISADGITSGMIWRFMADGDGFDVMNGDNYLNRRSGSSGISCGSEEGASYSDWMYSTSHDLYVYSSNVKKNYYLYQTSGSGNYYFGNDEAENGTIYLYKVPDVPINSVAITGITAPVAGAEPDSSADTPAGSNYSAGTVSWNPSPEGIFAGNTIYSVSVTLSADGGFAFLPGTTATVNGNAADLTLNPDSTATVTCTFPRTGSAPVIAYERASSVTAGEVYVIVSNKGSTNMALKNEVAQTSYLAGTEITVIDDAISDSVTGDMQWTAEAGASGMFFKNNGKYLARESQRNLMSTSSKPEDKYGDWRYDSSNNQFYVVGSQGSYYLYYSSNSDYFRVNSSAGEGEKIYLYKKIVTPVANLVIDTTSLGAAIVDLFYSETISVNYTGSGMLTFSADGLPSGLSIDANTGVISGTPTIGTDAGSPYSVEVTVSDGTLSVTESYSLVVNPAPVPPDITTDTLEDGMVGSAYNQALTATGDKPIIWTITGSGILPAGLELSTSGAITGTPAASGTSAFTVEAKNDAGSDTADFSIKIDPAPDSPVITTKTILPGGTVGTAYNTILEAAGNPTIIWTITGSGILPAGLELSTSGAITGTPTAIGTSAFTVEATNGFGSDTKTFSLTISNAQSIPSDKVPGGGGGGGGGGGSADLAVVSGSVSATLPITVNNNNAIVKIGTKESEGIKNGGKVVIKVPDVDADNYSINIPSGTLSESDGEGSLVFKTDIGIITLPANILADVKEAEGKNVEITIGQGEKANLPEDVKEAIGDRPLIQLTMSLDGKQFEWKNNEAPVTVSIPYKPTAEELNHPEGIVIWYIDGSGSLVSVPNGRYDPVSGTVIFETSHFSYYGVGYNSTGFNDISADAWYAKAVNFVAARGIVTGMGNGYYKPNNKLTRGQFIVMLMKAYGFAPGTDLKDNFADAGSTWYTGYLAEAKRTGISSGIGGNLFAPEKEITRQEMFTMLNNALKVIGQLPQSKTGKSLSSFSDYEQVASWAKDAMTLMVETGTVEGVNGKLMPKNSTTRAEMAQVLYVLLTK